ncbi:unnamed protein product [Orchesella dallaii]|uniref:Uncharacterized protein n=1 Tax=Orchesella dallaii TaxID=48710 RepID=A0ABP1R0D0_9HEXA
MVYYVKYLCGLLLVSVLVSAGPINTSKNVENSESKPRFFDDIFDDISSGMDINVSKIVGQGGSIVKKVQQVQGGGQTHIIKTEITSSSSYGGGHRFKRGVLDSLSGFVNRFDDKISGVKDKIEDVISTGVNVGYEAHNRIKQGLPA